MTRVALTFVVLALPAGVWADRWGRRRILIGSDPVRLAACFGAGNVVGDLLFLRWRPTYAMRVASLLLVRASCQAGICVTGAFTLWDTSLGEHIPPQSLSPPRA